MSDYIMVSSPTVQSDLVTKTDYVVYIPLATKETYGTVKIGEGLSIKEGVVSFDDTNITIKSISKNGELLIPDENKHIDITIDASDIGLENVDNTSDINKPVSHLQQIALDEKLDKLQGEDAIGKYLFVTTDGYVGFSDPSLYINAFNWVGFADQEITNIDFGYEFAVSVPQNKKTTLNLSGLIHSIIGSAFNVVDYDSSTGVLRFTRANGEEKVIDLPLELLVKSGYYDEFTQSLILVLANDDVISIPVDALVKDVYSKEEINELLKSKQNILTAGRGIQITEENVINVLIDDTISDISTNPVQNRVLYQVFDAFGVDVARIEEEKQDRLTAGENITIDENNVISATGGGLKIEDLPKFVNKIYITMISSLNGVLTLPIVSSSNFIVDWGDGTTTDYIEATTEISHTYNNTTFSGLIRIYGEWNGIVFGEASNSNKSTIREIVYDTNIMSIPEKAFYYCTGLKKIKLLNNHDIVTLGFSCFYNTALTEFEYPNRMTRTGNSAFALADFVKIYIPPQIQTIESFAFNQNSAKEVIVSEGVTKIEALAFQSNRFSEITIPSTVTSLSYAFNNCSNLKTIIYKGLTPPSIVSSYATTYMKTHFVPSSSLKSYKTATNWTAFADKIYPKGGTYSETITIPSTAWDSTTNTVTVEAVGATSEARNVITWFTSSGGSQVENTYGLKCTAQGTMQLTFSCETIPTEDVEVSVSYMLTNY